MTDWLGAVQQLRRDGEAGVLVTVTAVRGHAPRDAGAKMVVSAARTWGSVGGGNLEQTAVDRARALLVRGATTPETLEMRLNDHARTEHGRQCCGGEVTLLLEPLPVRPTVAIFGVGHVGYELARILSRLEVSLHLVDSRAAELDPLRLADVTEGVADVTVHRRLVGETVLERLPRGAHVLVMTHDHAEDFALCDAALRIPGLAGIGLIGSNAKWSRFRRLLAAEGHDEATIARITSPIGLPTITGKDPAVIAVSVAAALLEQLTAGRSLSQPRPLSQPRSLTLSKGPENTSSQPRSLSLSKGKEGTASEARAQAGPRPLSLSKGSEGTASEARAQTEPRPLSLSKGSEGTGSEARAQTEPRPLSLSKGSEGTASEARAQTEPRPLSLSKGSEGTASEARGQAGPRPLSLSKGTEGTQTGQVDT